MVLEVLGRPGEGMEEGGVVWRLWVAQARERGGVTEVFYLIS